MLCHYYLGERKPGELRPHQFQVRGDLHDLGDRVRRAEDEDVIQADGVEMRQLEKNSTSICQ